MHQRKDKQIRIRQYAHTEKNQIGERFDNPTKRARVKQRDPRVAGQIDKF